MQTNALKGRQCILSFPRKSWLAKSTNMWKYNCEKRNKYYEEVIRLYTQEGLGRTKISRIIPVGETTISRWIRNFASENQVKVIMKRRTFIKLVYLAYRDISEKWTMSLPNWALISQQLAIKFGYRFKIMWFCLWKAPLICVQISYLHTNKRERIKKSEPWHSSVYTTFIGFHV